MSNKDQNQAENANGDDGILDGEVAFLESMRKYLAPGGIYQQQQERNTKKQPILYQKMYELIFHIPTKTIPCMRKKERKLKILNHEKLKPVRTEKVDKRINK